MQSMWEKGNQLILSYTLKHLKNAKNYKVNKTAPNMPSSKNIFFRKASSS